MKCPTLRDDRSLEIAMTPMIDVVFLLLIFFVWTSSFDTPEADLPSPVAESLATGAGTASEDVPTPEVFDEIVVKLMSIEGGMQIEMNGEPIPDLRTLESRLTAVLELGVQPPVIIDPEPLVIMADAIAVFDAARQAGVDRVLFAITSPTPAPAP